MNGRTVVDLADADFLCAVDDPDGVEVLAAGLAAVGVGETTTTIGCPSSWGRPRRARLHRALEGIGPVRPHVAAELVPRALLIAASHADAAITVCTVVETLLVPGEPPGSGHLPEAELWTAQRVVRDGGTWRIDQCAAGDATESEDLVAFAARSELVLVDGAVADRLLPVLDGAAAGARVVPVDRGLVERHGWRWKPVEPIDFGFPEPPVAPPRKLSRALLVLMLVGVVVLGAAGVIARWPQSAADVRMTQSVGPVTLTVPQDWRRTVLSGDRPDDGRGLRAVFADDGDGRRLIVVVTVLRPGATRESVARSMANRIAQRGDDVVVEFAAESTYGGRPVISYREVPASGPAVSWYIVVEPAGQGPAAAPLQVSIGCQPGTGEDPIDPPCRTAVATVRISR